MNHKLLNKLVFRGMQKNRKTLIPFLMAGTFTVMIFYILQSLAYCPYIYYKGVEAFYGAQTIAIILGYKQSDHCSICRAVFILCEPVSD